MEHQHLSATTDRTSACSTSPLVPSDPSSKPCVFYVPGRVCLFGDKVDLKGFPVIAATVNKTMKVEIVKIPNTRHVRLYTENLKSWVEFELDDVSPQAPWRSHALKYWGAVATRLAPKISCGFEAKLTSEIPIGKGMASSGALTVGLARALNTMFSLGMTPADLAMVAYLAEHDDLSIPCGRMDQYAIAIGGVTHINTSDHPLASELEVPEKCLPLRIVVGDTLEPRPLQKLLKYFREKLAEHDPIVEDVYDRIADCVEAGRKAFEAGDLEAVGRLMREQMAQERRVGCITTGLEKLCNAAEAAGAYGAKLTGRRRRRLHGRPLPQWQAASRSRCNHRSWR